MGHSTVQYYMSRQGEDLNCEGKGLAECRYSTDSVPFHRVIPKLAKL